MTRARRPPRPPRLRDPRDPIARDGLRPRFWETVPLDRMTGREWEALCDGCGKCCLNKLEDADTRRGRASPASPAACSTTTTCRCTHYEARKTFVPECVVLTPKNIHKNAYWMPTTCAYRLLAEGKRLHDWHPLISGDPESVHAAGVSVRGITVSEFEVAEDEWEDHIIEEPT